MTNKLFYIALVTSVAGLLLLTYVADVLEPDIIEISKIDNDYLYKMVHVQGEIVDLKKFKGGSVLLKVDDKTGIIDVYLPYHVAKKVNVKEGRGVDVIGEVDLWEGNLEIKINDLRHITII